MRNSSTRMRRKLSMICKWYYREGYFTVVSAIYGGWCLSTSSGEHLESAFSFQFNLSTWICKSYFVTVHACLQLLIVSTLLLHFSKTSSHSHLSSIGPLTMSDKWSVLHFSYSRWKWFLIPSKRTAVFTWTGCCRNPELAFSAWWKWWWYFNRNQISILISLNWVAGLYIWLRCGTLLVWIRPMIVVPISSQFVRDGHGTQVQQPPPFLIICFEIWSLQLGSEFGEAAKWERLASKLGDEIDDNLNGTRTKFAFLFFGSEDKIYVNWPYSQNVTLPDIFAFRN